MQGSRILPRTGKGRYNDNASSSLFILYLIEPLARLLSPKVRLPSLRRQKESSNFINDSGNQL